MRTSVPTKLKWQSVQKNTDRKIDIVQDLNNTFDSDCTFTQKYDLRSRNIQSGLNVACSEKILLHDVSKAQWNIFSPIFGIQLVYKV